MPPDPHKSLLYAPHPPVFDLWIYSWAVNGNAIHTWEKHPLRQGLVFQRFGVEGCQWKWWPNIETTRNQPTISHAKGFILIPTACIHNCYCPSFLEAICCKHSQQCVIVGWFVTETAIYSPTSFHYKYVNYVHGESLFHWATWTHAARCTVSYILALCVHSGCRLHIHVI